MAKMIVLLALLGVGVLATAVLVRAVTPVQETPPARGGALATTTLAINGMTCGSCVAAVKLQLGRTEGVTRYDVSLQKAAANVTYDPAKTTPEQIAGSVSRIGFQASVNTSRAGEQGPEVAPDISIPQEERVTVFEVPLRCRAAANLGCGTRARPLLLELEGHGAVAEAWLNRRGTQLAIAWEERSEAAQRAQSIRDFLAGHKEIELQRISAEALLLSLKELKGGRGWYRGAAVDRLSEEEATIIASRFMNRARKKVAIPEDVAQRVVRKTADVIARGLKAASGDAVPVDQILAEVLEQASADLDQAQVQEFKNAIETGYLALPGEE